MALNMYGSLNENKYRKSDNQPTHTGNCMIDDKKYKIAVWPKSGQNGDYLSLKFTLDDGVKKEWIKPNEAPAPVVAPEGKAALDDDMIPF